MVHRWFATFAALLGVCLIATAAAPARAQEKPPASAAKSDLKAPKLPPYTKMPDHNPVQVFCTEDDKAAAIKALEEGLAQVQAQTKKDLKDLDDYLAASTDYVAAMRAAGKTAEADRQASEARMFEAFRGTYGVAEVNWFTRAIARAKTRKVVDCREPKRMVPPAPPMTIVQSSPYDSPCTEAERAAILKALTDVQDILRENYQRAEDHYDELRALQAEAAKPGSRFAKALDLIRAATKAYDGVVAQEEAAYRDMNSEIYRVTHSPLKDCPRPKTATGPAPAKPVDPGSPKTSDGPKPPPPPPEPPKPEAPKLGEGHGSLPWTPHRPALQPAETPAIPAFCDEFQRNGFLNASMLPELARANANVEAANAYLTGLNGEFAQANRTGAAVAQVVAIKQEIDAYGIVAQAQQASAAGLQAEFQTALHQPLGPACPTRTASLPTPPVPPVDGPSTPATPPAAPPPADSAHPCHCLDSRPIEVGSNARVGSGARARDKAISTAVGLVGGLLGGGGGGGGGGASDGPQLVVCRIADKEMTVFDDPATGVSLKVGAKRSGDKVVVFADVAQSPDDGTFQAAWLQDGEGARQAPHDLGICGLWGEWKLTVSWTRTTYVNDQVVSRESGGWSRAGEFHIPGVVSTTAAPDGLWKRLGFSNASHGARMIAMTYDAPRAMLAAGPLGVMIHVTRPGQSPVTTAPFALMLRETPTGFVFARPPACLCDNRAVKGSFSEVPVQETEVSPIDYRTGDEDAAKRKIPGLPKTTPKPSEPGKTEPPKTVSKPEDAKPADKSAEAPKTVSKAETAKDLEDGPQETDAETAARAKKAAAAEDKRTAENAPKRDAFDKKVDEVARTSGPAGGADKIKPTASLDDNGVPIYGAIDYYKKDFPLPIYETAVDGQGNVTGGGYTNAYRAYMTMKAAVNGEPMQVDNSYRNGPDGKPYIDHAKVTDGDGKLRGEFTFGPDGNAKTGAIFDASGHQTGVLNNP